MTVEQLLLFSEPSGPKIIVVRPIVLNGFYYEQSSHKFVSFVQGRRYYEILASRCKFDRDWQDKIKRERSI
ncbi:hypothetical protein [Cohnella boryungensis]|uniref:KTSC domain-containing protein n=1 Tax=Cohnella boryungensis TaxID=768479 RepID=A0ABV8SFH2_9BACL